MNIIAHGVDIAVLDRIEQIYDDHSQRFLDRVYSKAEQEYCLGCKTPIVRLAGRFAAKEAVLKVFGTGLRSGINWYEIETLPDKLGKPIVTLHGSAAQMAESLGITEIMMSISHAGDYAVASAIGVGQ